MTLTDLKPLVVLTLRDPARAVAWLRGLDLPLADRWGLLVVAVALSSLLAWAAALLFPVPVDTVVTRAVGQPLIVAGVQLGAIALTAALMAGVGRMFGGTGTFADALLMIGWIEIMLLLVQVGQVMLMLLFPAVATLMSLAAIALFAGLLVLFTKHLHGFRSTPKVAVGVVATFIVTGLALSILFAALGLAPVPAPAPPA